MTSRGNEPGGAKDRNRTIGDSKAETSGDYSKAVTSLGKAENDTGSDSKAETSGNSSGNSKAVTSRGNKPGGAEDRDKTSGGHDTNRSD